jgi:hypothetical protein
MTVEDTEPFIGAAKILARLVPKENISILYGHNAIIAIWAENIAEIL